jgi:dolichol-phosphate mannosyltransferase
LTRRRRHPATPTRAYASTPTHRDPDDRDSPVTAPGVPRRVRDGLGKRDNWAQLAKFCLIGASGYIVNLVTFAFCHEVLDAHHLVAATAAFLIAVTNNFIWNRHWTFNAGSGRARAQAPRFLAVSLSAFVLAAIILDLLVKGGVPAIPAQALSIAAATPVNFVGNKLWTFDLGRPPH